MIEEKTKETDNAMEFYNPEIEGLIQRDKVNEDKIKHLEDELL